MNFVGLLKGKYSGQETLFLPKQRYPRSLFLPEFLCGSEASLLQLGAWGALRIRPEYLPLGLL